MHALALFWIAVTPALSLANHDTSVQAAPSSEFDELLARARTAAGREQWPAGHDLALAGRGLHRGVEVEVSADFARDGRFSIDLDGQLTRRIRFDGSGVWRAEYSTLWEELELFDREFERLRGWVHGGAWLDPKTPVVLGPAEGWAARAGHLGLNLRGADGRLDARVELDAEDYRVRHLIVPSGGAALRAEFADYRSVQGVWIAHSVRWELFGGEVRMEIERARWAEPTSGRFARPPDVRDYRFDPKVPAEVEVVRSNSKHLWVRPLVDGKDVGLFLFDTGAGFSGLSVEAAEELGLLAFGQTSVTGLGGEVREVRLRRAGRLQLGPLTIDAPVFSEVPVEGKTRMVGEKVGGVLGWDVMRRAIVDLEPRGVLRLHDPEGFELAGSLDDAEWKPLQLNYRVPYIGGRFPGSGGGPAGEEGEELFMLDCGAAGVTVMFFHHAALALGLLADGEREATDQVGEGAGGAFHHRLSSMAWFEFAGDRMDDMTILLSTAPDGESDPYSLGLIGGGLLRLYRLIFDVPAGRVAILPL